MNALLWTLVFMAAINTAAVFVQAVVGFSPIGMTARAVDWVYTLGMGAWALWLLSKD